MRELTCHVNNDCPGSGYSVLIGADLLESVGSIVAERLGVFRQVALITDEGIPWPLVNRLESSFPSYHGNIMHLILPDREQTKTLETAGHLYGWLIDEGFQRKDAIVAFGGGMIGDLAGFVASTYLRGVPFINVPTTLLAQTDSALGGKVAVNHPRGKNLIGTFYDPHIVISDVSTLDTLSDRAYLSGLGEVIKYALIRDANFLQSIEEKLDMIRQRDHDVLEVLVEKCSRHKLDIVIQDHHDHGLRGILNFGHTVGHGLEMASRGLLLHGEAVTLGMVAACWLSMDYCSLSREDYHRFVRIFQQLNLPLPTLSLSKQAVRSFMGQDKKRTGASLTFILLPGCGRTQTCCEIGEEAISNALDHVSTLFPGIVFSE